MRGLRFRMNIIVVLTFAIAAHFAWSAYSDSEVLFAAQKNVSQSLALRELALETQQRQVNDPTVMHELKSLKSVLNSRTRRESVGELQRALASEKKADIRASAAALANQENKLYETMLRETTESWGNVAHSAESAFAALVCGFLLFLYVARIKIFRPLDRLSRRMMDFLVDRYSFQFADPEQHELGELQRTFNALAQRVVNTMDEMKALDQVKSDFLNIATHELRTPLTSIKGSLSLIDSGVMGAIDPGCARLIKIAEVETDRLIRLINELLDLAKIDAGKLPLARTWLPWDELAATTQEGLLGLTHKTAVNIKVEVAPGLEVYIDRDRVQQVLTNLIANAIKFSPEGSWVHVTIGRSAKGEALINVRDHGPGIAREDQKQIFHKFRQASSSSPLQDGMPGTGLGLAIAQALVHEHGGEIGVESEPGQGATFWFTLPEWRDEMSSSADEASKVHAA